jgi:pectate lyase
MSVLVLCLLSPLTGQAAAPDGFATVAGTTTGGAGGPVVTVTTFAALQDYVSRDGPYVIQVSGTIEDPAPTAHGIRIASDKTVIGVTGAKGPAILRNVYFATASSTKSQTRNLIFRNLTMIGSPQDCLSLRRTDHVWIDHCDFSDTQDGEVDITRSADYVTVSWCRFHYTDAFVASRHDAGHHHFFPMLIGETEHDTDDIGKLHVTLHHNWFGPNAVERMPSVRFGTVHVYNNYYDHIPATASYTYCIEARLYAQVLVQNNYFDHSHSPQQLKVTTGTPPILQAAGNIYDHCTGNEQSHGTAFTPPYPFTLDSAASVPATVKANAHPL